MASTHRTLQGAIDFAKDYSRALFGTVLVYQTGPEEFKASVHTEVVEGAVVCTYRKGVNTLTHPVFTGPVV
jgi:hypothetical protein